MRRQPRSTLAMSAFLALTLLTSDFAQAHVSPAGCTANNVVVTLSRDRSFIVSGETVNYTVAISNGGAGACDASDVDVVFTCPAPDGTPAGTSTTLTTTGSYPANGSGNTCWNATGTDGCVPDSGLSCVVTVNSGVTIATAKVLLGDPTLADKTKGVLHDSPEENSFSSSKELAISVVEASPTPTVTQTPTHTQTPTVTPTPAPTYTRTAGAPATPGRPTTPGPPFPPPKPPTKTPKP